MLITLWAVKLPSAAASVRDKLGQDQSLIIL